jgi:acyl carrier protein
VITEEVAALFAEVLKIEVPSHDTNLLATGLLDSLGFVELLLQLERRFGIHVEMESLEPEDFRSIESIAAFVGAQRQTVG